MRKPAALKKLVAFLQRIPALKANIGAGQDAEGLWWVKFQLDIRHPLAWHVVQELSCVVNYISVSERLPTVFYPVSPAPYLNGGPSEFLAWVIENRDASFTANDLAQWLEGRLPQPVEDASKWPADEDPSLWPPDDDDTPEKV